MSASFPLAASWGAGYEPQRAPPQAQGCARRRRRRAQREKSRLFPNAPQREWQDAGAADSYERKTRDSNARRELTDAPVTGNVQVGRDIAQRIQDEVALRQTAMRHDQIAIRNLRVGIHQEIEIDSTRPPTHHRHIAAER